MNVVGAWEPFFTQRYVSYAPYEIAVNKQDGPAMQMRWWNCFNENAVGPTVNISNADPAGYVWLTYEYPTAPPFCIQGKGQGSVDYDYFSAILSYDGY